MTEEELRGLEVTQEDRRVFIEIGRHEGWSIANDEDEEIMSGEYDSDHSMQAITRHRVASTSSLLDRIAALEGALAKAGEQFRDYERYHRAKLADPDPVGPNPIAAAIDAKAERNREMAEMCEAALSARTALESGS